MWLRVVVISLVMSLVAAVQIALLPALNMSATINLALVILVLSVFVASRRSALFCALVLGLIFEAWSFWSFGAMIVILTLITILVSLAVDNFFTNKSLYSYLLLIVVMTLIYELYWLLVASLPAPIMIDQAFTWLLLQKMAVNTGTGIVLFYITLGLSNSFQSVILIKKKY